MENNQKSITELIEYSAGNVRLRTKTAVWRAQKKTRDFQNMGTCLDCGAMVLRSSIHPGVFYHTGRYDHRCRHAYHGLSEEIVL